jgi:hypothetical protein
MKQFLSHLPLVLANELITDITVLLQKLSCSVCQEFLSDYGSRRIIIVFTTTPNGPYFSHFSPLPHKHFSNLLPSTLRLNLPCDPISLILPTPLLYAFPIFSEYATCPVHLTLLHPPYYYFVKNTRYEPPHYTISLLFTLPRLLNSIKQCPS